METELNRITEKTKKEKKYKLRNLVYLVNEGNLRSSYDELKRDRASGIDGVNMDG
jgi:predicted nucleotidyltransferase